MRTTSKLLALALTATMQSAMAGGVFLDFEGLASTAKLPASYNGVNVGGAAWGATSDVPPCTDTFGVNFKRQGSCGALWLAQQPEVGKTGLDETLRLSIADGFVDALSFFFSASNSTSTLSVRIYDAAGNILAKNDGLTGTGGGGVTWSTWSNEIDPDTKKSDRTQLSFTGVASYVTFTGLDQAFLLDDIRFTTPTAAAPLPEPASLALAFSALGALGWARRRAAR